MSVCAHVLMCMPSGVREPCSLMPHVSAPLWGQDSHLAGLREAQGSGSSETNHLDAERETRGLTKDMTQEPQSLSFMGLGWLG